MKSLLFACLVISGCLTAMEKIWHHTDFDTDQASGVQSLSDSGEHLDDSDNQSSRHAIYQPCSLRALCMNKITQQCAINPQFKTAPLTMLPPELAVPLLERLKSTVTGSTYVASLAPACIYKMSPDGTRILEIPNDDTLPLCIRDGKTGARVLTLEQSLSADNKQPNSKNTRFIPIKWSTSGAHVYACYKDPSASFDNPKYQYKIWNAHTGRVFSYLIPLKPCAVLYLSSDDRWILAKIMGKPLKVYQTSTGAFMKTLGKANSSHKKEKWYDPQHEWISVRNDNTTQLFDTRSLECARTLRGYLKCFGDQGRLLISHEEINEPRVNQALIYNREGQLLSSILLRGYLSWYCMALNPTSTLLRVYDSDREQHYTLDDKKLVRNLSIDKKTGAGSSYYDIPLKTCITLSKDKSKKGKTQIAISNESGVRQLQCTGKINMVRHTHCPNVVALCEYAHIRFWLELATGTLIPCNSELKSGLYSLKPLNQLSANEYWVDGDRKLMHLARPPTVEAIITMLKAKRAKD